ncbi:MAG TPA: alpha/beta fold hydrolase [Burkholderiales bacterium]|nr:alpha/beta fold hydrolase [Burkholderiales bacterium]
MSSSLSTAMPAASGTPKSAAVAGRSRASAVPGYFRLDRPRDGLSDAPGPRLRLVLFGFAGGTITALMSLAKAFPSWIEVWGAEYSGRGLRWQSPLLESLDLILDDLLPGLAQLSRQPVAMLGYSMGAHVAYRLALRTVRPPLGLVVVSGRPPRWGSSGWAEEDLSDGELIARLQALGGMPPEVLDSRVMMDSFMPVMRADLELCADMNRFAPRTLPCPLLVLEGTHDRLLVDADVPLWLNVAGGLPGQSLHRAYPGGHFFHKGTESGVARDIASWLTTLRAAAISDQPEPSIVP